MNGRLSIDARRIRRRRRGLAGFTLIEVMLAGAIFLLALAGTLQGISLASREYEHQRRATSGLAVIESVMEELLLLQSSDPLLASGSRSREYDIDGNLEVGGPVLAEWTVTLNVPVTGLRQIALRVSWVESNGTRRGLDVTTWRP